MLLVLPLVGMVLGLVAWSTIRRYPQEYTGSRLAILGTVLLALQCSSAARAGTPTSI